jgi:plasmid stabilization system protein ParE
VEKITEVIWTGRSLTDLRKIVIFNTELHDEERAFQIPEGIVNDVENELLGSLDVAARDQQFSHINNYKKLLNGHHKITFRSENHTAYIVRVFDMRQHPDKNQ